MIIDVDTLKHTHTAAVNYFNRAIQFRNIGQRHSLVFNMGAVALENYLIALCELNADPPASHDFVMLVDVLESHIEIPDNVSEGIRSLNDIFSLCSVENYCHKDPEVSDAELVLSLCEELEKLFDNEKLQWIYRQKRRGPFLEVR